MSEHDYEYECMRAELLGLPKPDKTEISQTNDRNDDTGLTTDIDTAAEDLDAETETLKRTTGGLDEINSILQNTQKKINKFKTVFGSVTSLLRGRLGAEGVSEDEIGQCSSANSSEQPASNDLQVADDGVETPQIPVMGKTEARAERGTHIEGMLSSHIQTLDSMVYKADDINAKMNFQNKQMKNYLNK